MLALHLQLALGSPLPGLTGLDQPLQGCKKWVLGNR